MGESVIVSGRIPADNLHILERRVDALNRRAVRLGLPGLTLTVGETVEVRRGACVHEMTDVTFAGALPVLPGWRLVAVLSHVVDEPILLRVPRQDGPAVDLTAYRDRANECDHCRTRRARKDTYLLANEDGRITQVGRDCLGSFLGRDPETVCAQMMYVADVLALGLEHGSDVGSPRGVETLALLAQTAACIRAYGWVSKAQAGSGLGQATADTAVAALLWDPMRGQWSKTEATPPAVTDGDRALAAEALAWARDLSPSAASEYLSNLGRLCRAEWITLRFAGYVASAVPSYAREKGRRLERVRAAAVSRHVGEVGSRYRWSTGRRATSGLTLTVLSERIMEGQYGTRALYKLVDADGNRCTWWSSRAEVMTQGQTYRVDATVKAHSVYQGVAETVLTRVTVVSGEGCPTECAVCGRRYVSGAKFVCVCDSAAPFAISQITS